MDAERREYNCGLFMLCMCVSSFLMAAACYIFKLLLILTVDILNLSNVEKISCNSFPLKPQTSHILTSQMDGWMSSSLYCCATQQHQNHGGPA